jgi:hypothetical protein
MTLREHLIHLADSYGTAKNLSRSRVSTLVFNGGHVLNRVAEQDGDVTTATFERAVRWFDANWPDDLPWPADLPRPSLVAQANDTEAA